MPTYEYACRSCGQGLEVVQSFTDDPLTECPQCGGQLRKVFGNVGIAFKGSGFYKNDSRSSAKSGSSSTAAGGNEGDAASKPAADAGTKTETKAETKPETKAPAPSTPPSSSSN